MDLDELQSVQSRERQTDSLQQLRATFYQDAAEYIHSLEDERDSAAERADDPWNSPEVGRLNDDIDTAEGTVEAIYERRVGKIVKMASLAAADMPTEDDGLTDEERLLFETLVNAIEENREHVFAILDGEDPADVRQESETEAPDERAPPPETERDSAVDAADLMGGADANESEDPGEPIDGGSKAEPDGTSGREPSDDRDIASEPTTAGSDADLPDTESPDGETAEDGESDTEASSDAIPDVDRTTVRITSDVGEIFGVDERAYDLNADDVVTLPAANAEPLVDSDAAEPLE